MNVIFETSPILSAQIRSKKLDIVPDKEFVIVQLDRRSGSHYRSKEAIRIALKHARQGKRVVLFGLCPIRDYQRDNHWGELISYSSVSFAQNILEIISQLK